MHRRRGIFLASLLILAVGMAIPIVSHASGSGHEGAVTPQVSTGNCLITIQPYPGPPVGASTVGLSPADSTGKAWVSVNGTSSQAGANGAHGFFVADAGGARGYSKDSTLNGQVNIGGVCLSVLGDKVAAP